MINMDNINSKDRLLFSEDVINYLKKLTIDELNEELYNTLINGKQIDNNKDALLILVKIGHVRLE
jgi:hypothetical protein